MKPARALHWFRRDLRLRDNTALLAAQNAATDGVVGLYVVCPGQWREHDESAVKVDFWLRNLRELESDLDDLNIPLVIAHAKTLRDVPKVVGRVCDDARCDALFFNKEYEVNERRRDDAVRDKLLRAGKTVHGFDDRTILPPGEVVTKQGGWYTVYTPFLNRWLEELDRVGWSVGDRPRKQKPLEGVGSTGVPDGVKGFGSSVDPALWPAGERSASGRLGSFVADRIEAYDDRRDIPSESATSTLSPYLAAGVLSPRACLDAAMNADGGAIRAGKQHKGRETGPGVWISELVWREFYIHLTFTHPRVSMSRAFKPDTEKLAWQSDEHGFRAWCEGRTGFPIVDAGMRQLNATGWMHNRLRMIVAMFLTKDLFVDWRRGERYFMRRLVDGELASNNGGWQWSASTGTDAAPYFRIYNPETQGRRFDPDGAYVREWMPELARLPGKKALEPWRLPDGERSGLDYPDRIVDHKKARDRVMEAFQALAADRRS